MSARVAALMAALLLVAGAAAAQPGQSGPMTVERLHNGVQGFGDVRLTSIDGHSATLIGGEAAWVVEDTIGFGGAGYWLADGSHDRQMAYGGFTVRFFGHANDRLGYGLRALIGGGEATLDEPFVQFVPVRNPLTGRIASTTLTTSVPFERSFFITEPEATAFFRLAPHLRVTGGVSYRLIGSYGHDDDRLRGVSGTIGVQVF